VVSGILGGHLPAGPERDAYRAALQEVGEATSTLSIADQVAFFAAQRAAEREASGEDDLDWEDAVLASVRTLQIREEAQRRVANGGKPVEAKPIKVLSITDLLSRPDPEWWVEGLLQESTVAVLAGEAGVGKSFLMLHLAACMATGTPFFGRAVKRGKVLYVAAEGAASFGKRVRAWESFNSVSIPEDRIGFIEEGVNLSSPESMVKMNATLTEEEPDLIILDTLSQLAEVDNENDAAQLAAVFRVAKTLRDVRPGSTVVVVHHVNKGAGKVRGSSVIRSNVDTVMVARGNSKGFSLSTEIAQDGKQKDGIAETIDGFELESHGPSAVVIWTGVKPVDPVWKGVRMLLADGAKHKSADVKLATDLGDTQATNRLKSYVADGHLLTEGNGPAKVYWLPEVLA
jgi:hypothetical protein